MGLGLGNWALTSGDSFESGGTINGNLWVNGNLTANTYYSGATPLWDIIEDYMTPPVTAMTFDSIGLAATDETTALTSGATKVSFRMPYDFQLTGITAYVRTSGSTATIVDVNSGSTSLLISAITIPANQFYTVASNLLWTALTEHDIITVDIDSAGTAAAGLKLWLEGYKLQTALGGAGNGGPSTFVQNGINTFTGGTDQYPSVNITAATLSYLSATSISAATIYSGNTPLSTIISNIASQTPWSGLTDSGHTGQYQQIYSSNDTWTAPLGVFSVVVELWGGGGGGGGGAHTPALSNNGGGGGASGAYILGEVPVTPGTTYSILIGSGGTGGYFRQSEAPIQPTSGGNSSFSTFIGFGGAPGTNGVENGAGGTGGTATYMTGSSQNFVYNSEYFFTRGYDGAAAQGVGGGSDTSGGNGGDTPMFGRIKFNNDNGGVGGVTPNVAAAQYGGNATFFGGGGAGGTGYFTTVDTGKNWGYSGGSGTGGLVILKWNAGSGNTYQYNNVFSGGTISGNTNVDANLSANTYYSGNTSLETILGRYAASAHTHPISDIINLQGSLNSKVDITGTTFDSRFNSKANLSGATFTGNVIVPTISASTFSGGTYLSGGTNLYSIFLTTADVSATTISAGANISVSNIGLNYTVSVSGTPSFNGGSFSGAVSATTYVSGTTPFDVILGRYAYSSHTHNISDINNLQGSLDSKANLSGATFTGAVSASTLSAGTIFSGSNNLNQIFAPKTVLLPYDFALACSDETTQITTGTSKVTFLSPCSFVVTGVTASLSSSGSTLTTVNVKNNGTTIFSTKATIDANEFDSTTAATAPVITGGTWTQFNKITVDIDGAGTGAKGLKLIFNGTRTVTF